MSNFKDRKTATSICLIFWWFLSFPSTSINVTILCKELNVNAVNKGLKRIPISTTAWAIAWVKKKYSRKKWDAWKCSVTKLWYLCNEHILHSVSLGTCYKRYIICFTQKFFFVCFIEVDFHLGAKLVVSFTQVSALEHVCFRQILL